jgi:hypothetical protein
MAEFKPYKLKLFDELELDIPRNNRAEALEAAADFIKTEMLDYIGDGVSPVTGRAWAGLSKEYAARKTEQSSSNSANLELTGHLLDGLTVEVSGNSIVIDVDESDYGKAEGHITGIYGNHSKKVKRRKFMPQDGESFTGAIMRDLKKVLSEFEDG